MGDHSGRPARPELLAYRPWRGTFRPPAVSVWPIARIALWMIFRRKLFWAVYALGLLFFLMFFFGQYLLAFGTSQMDETEVRAGILGRVKPQDLVRLIREVLKINGSGETYRNFFWFQGNMVMILLALAGSILVGNDLRFGTLPYYLSKPLSRWHYLLGKGLALGVVINLLTTLPATILFIQYGLLDNYDYFSTHAHLLAGIFGYGLILTVCLSLLLLATATWVRRTVPLIMTWTALFVFFPLLSQALVEGLKFDKRLRLMDLWNDTYLMAHVCLQVVPSPGYPAWYEAALVLGGVCLSCLIYLILRIQALEIVR
jgi:ABC-type transport system involved in multi-copper enzyme maturation permease subunit